MARSTHGLRLETDIKHEYSGELESTEIRRNYSIILGAFLRDVRTLLDPSIKSLLEKEPRVLYLELFRVDDADLHVDQSVAATRWSRECGLTS